MKSIDYAAFSRKIERDDVARPNLFKIAFSNLGMSITKDGVINFEPNDQGSGIGRDNDSPWRDGFDSVRSRVQDRVTSNLFRNSGTFRRLTGAYSPKLIRLVGGDELLDGVLGSEPDINRDIALMVKSANIPGVTYDTDIMMTDKKPFHLVKGRNQADFTVTFICSPSYIERRLFLAWFNAIHDPYTNTFEFYNTYRKNIDMYTYTRQGRIASAIHLQDCFPVDIGEIQLDYESNNQIATFNVVFRCSVVSHLDPGDVSRDAANIFDEVDSSLRELRRVSNVVGGPRIPTIP